MDYKTWRHAFKVDPAKQLADEELEQLAESGTDAIIIGGSDGVTLENVLGFTGSHPSIFRASGA